MRLKSLFALLSISLAMQGCATSPTDASGRELTVDDVGPAPEPLLEVVKQAVLPRLKDPDSAKFRKISTPVKAVVKGSMISNAGVGWAFCAEVNAKNSYGGYTGFEPVYILWDRGQVINYLDGDWAQIACKNMF